MQEAAISTTLKVIRETGLAPDSGGAYERNEFSEPKRLASSQTQKAKFLDTLSLMSRLPATFVANWYIA